MKKFFVILALVSSAAFAQWSPPPGNPFPPTPVFPSVSNNGYSAQIWVSNHNQSFVWCTGSLSMYMDGPDHRVHTAQVNMSVPPRGYMNRTYTPNSPGRIMRVSHNIFCR